MYNKDEKREGYNRIDNPVDVNALPLEEKEKLFKDLFPSSCFQSKVEQQRKRKYLTEEQAKKLLK